MPRVEPAAGPVVPAARADPEVERVRALLADVLDRPDAGPDDSFVSLGGDSLSYVEASLRLEDALGHLPARWHTTPVRDLAAAARPRPRSAPLARAARWSTLDGSVALRAVAILLVVGSHANVFVLVGGAHVLLAVVGLNLARFHLTAAPRRERQRALARSALRLAVPALAWVGLWLALTDSYDAANLVFLTSLLGPDELAPPWEYWFVEVVVQVLLVAVAVAGVPAFDRAERRWPFGTAAAVVGLGLLPRAGLVDLGPGPDAIQSAPAVLWLVALGWATARARTLPQRLAVTAAAALAVPGFFDDPRRETVVLAGLLLLVWVPRLRVPRPVHAAAGVLAANSLYIYLTHWQVFPHLQDDAPLLALAASVAVGVAYGRLVGAVNGRVERALAARRARVARAGTGSAGVPRALAS